MERLRDRAEAEFYGQFLVKEMIRVSFMGINRYNCT